MNRRMFLVALMLVAGSIGAGHAEAQRIVEVDASLHGLGTPKETFLEAGTYTVVPVEGAWNAWGFTQCSVPSGCDRTGIRRQGWLNIYRVSSPHITSATVAGVALAPIASEVISTTSDYFVVSDSVTAYVANDTFSYPTEADALVRAKTSSFTLAEDGFVGFSVLHDRPSGNLGGMTLRVRLVGQVDQPFSKEDLVDSSWLLYARSDDPADNAPGWATGNIQLDSARSVVGGFQNDNFGGFADFTGGNLSIDEAGLISGSITRTPGGADPLSDYKMSSSLVLIGGVDSDPGGRVRLTLAVRAGNGGTPFMLSELAGDWHYFNHFDWFFENDPGWERGLVTIDATGMVTNTTGIDSDGSPVSLTGLGLSIDSNTGVLFSQITAGALKLTPDRQMIVGVTRDVEGYQSMLVFVRSGGAFALSDLAGRWHLHTVHDTPSRNDPAWRRRILEIDDSGAITAGSVLDSTGGSDVVVGGSLSITPAGIVSGTIDYASGPSESISEYKMSEDLQLIVGVGTDAADFRSLTVAIVPEPSSGMGAFAVLLSLVALRRRQGHQAPAATERVFTP